MSSIIAFPHSLGEDVSKGGHHVSFEIIGQGFDPDIFKIHLYIPQGFALGDGANYGNVDLGMIGAAESLIKKDEKGKRTGELDMSGAEAKAIGTALLDKLGLGSDLGNSKLMSDQIKSGVALRNESTLTFEGASVRTFELSFTLVASSAKEAETIRVIEHTFRKYMYAKKEGTFAVKYPPLFRIKFMKGKEVNEFLPFLYDSYLTGLNTSYNNNANMFHKDGSPTDVNIQLSFQEQRQLTRDDLYHVPGKGGQEKPPGHVQQKFSYPAAKE